MPVCPVLDLVAPGTGSERPGCRWVAAGTYVSRRARFMSTRAWPSLPYAGAARGDGARREAPGKRTLPTGVAALRSLCIPASQRAGKLHGEIAGQDLRPDPADV